MRSLGLADTLAIQCLQVCDETVNATVLFEKFFTGAIDRLDNGVLHHGLGLRIDCPRVVLGIVSGETSKGERRFRLWQILSSRAWTIGFAK